VGRAFNVTRERIRQVEHQSLKKLQSLRQTQQLRDDTATASRYPLRTPGSKLPGLAPRAIPSSRTR
ncbi:MAG TPA: sigma factor-like helix-turn-helix DNA-binding protein, partial [Isosphaeraceae bacterium]|nr:sigma factor-like helix-turn-helix DNA-binding protein [Isosphaeraceae bacterium]